MNYKTLGKKIYEKYLNEYDCDLDDDQYVVCSRSIDEIGWNDFGNYSAVEDAIEYAKDLENAEIHKMNTFY